MPKLIITVLGKDRPGIIAAVTKSLYQADCNLENVNQMILQNEFAGFFVIECPPALDADVVWSILARDLKETGLRFHVDSLEAGGNGSETGPEETFIITTIGPDQKGLVARFTEIIARYGVNVTNLKAVFKGGDDPRANIMCYEVAITADSDQPALFRELKDKAAELDLDITIQHRNIFQAINKI